jgi:pimeloyl-ACP methyl ester carboxylesterase
MSRACTTSIEDPKTSHIALTQVANSEPAVSSAVTTGPPVRLAQKLRHACTVGETEPGYIVRWKLVGLALVIAVVLLTSARLLSRRFVFPVDALVPPGARYDAVSREFRARDGAIVHALEVDASVRGRTIVYFHNNRETVESRLGLAHSLASRGFDTLLVEYRGYGVSAGTSPTEEGLYADAEAALDMLAARGVPPSRIILWGTSLGTGVAAEMASRGRGSQLVLVTPYTSIPELVTNVAPFVPARFLVADHFDTLSKVARIRVPTTIVHGDADEIVPFWMGERIAQSIPGARLVRVRGGHHGDVLDRDGDRLLNELFGAGG